jgi:hypothetical protein
MITKERPHLACGDPGFPAHPALLNPIVPLQSARLANLKVSNHPIPPVCLPMQYRNFAAPKKICPSDTAGELSV